jgi:hypothetical protein
MASVDNISEAKRHKVRVENFRVTNHLNDLMENEIICLILRMVRNVLTVNYVVVLAKLKILLYKCMVQRLKGLLKKLKPFK